MDQVNNISGVILTPLKKIKNPLGDLYHGMKNIDPGYNGFEEAYFSTINHRKIKPWKKHLKMTLNLIVPIGKVRFVLFDDRDNSGTKGNFMDLTLSLDNYFRLTVPPDIWMAFSGKTNSLNLLLNIANLKHDSEEILRLDIEEISYKW